MRQQLGCGRGAGAAEPVEAAVGKACEAWCELQAEEVEQREDDVAVASGVAGVLLDRQFGLVSRIPSRT